MVRKGWLVFFFLPMLLTGCVDVELQVGSRGKVTQTFTVTVSQRAADVLKAAIENYLGRHWRIMVERKGEMNIVRAWRSYSARPEGKPMPGVVVQFRRTNHWFRATYELLIRYNPADLLQTKDEQTLAANRKVTMRIAMPGRILPEQSTVGRVDGSEAEVTIDPLNRLEIRVVAMGVLWWRIGLLLLILAILVWLLAPYLPRLAERFQRRTVRVVQR
ncbi:MAG: hypothetical protein IMHGJWDQ_000582 [Candidatus Fervidibacter sp.]